MNYAAIKPYDIANGPGVRVSLFVSGCTHKCKDCFNSEAWDFKYGEKFTDEIEDQIIADLDKDYISGFSLLGGEPFEPQNQETTCRVLERVRKTYPDKNIWCYSGYLMDEELLKGKVGSLETVKRMLNCIDFLVDGEFVLEKKDITLKFKGSSNQRIIDVQKSLKTGEIIRWSEDRIDE